MLDPKMVAVGFDSMRRAGLREYGRAPATDAEELKAVKLWASRLNAYAVGPAEFAEAVRSFVDEGGDFPSLGEALRRCTSRRAQIQAPVIVGLTPLGVEIVAPSGPGVKGLPVCTDAATLRKAFGAPALAPSRDKGDDKPKRKPLAERIDSLRREMSLGADAKEDDGRQE